MRTEARRKTSGLLNKEQETGVENIMNNTYAVVLKAQLCKLCNSKYI